MKQFPVLNTGTGTYLHTTVGWVNILFKYRTAEYVFDYSQKSKTKEEKPLFSILSSLIAMVKTTY